MSALSNISIRRCEPDDAAMVSLVAGATFLDGFYDFTPGPDIAAHVKKHHSDAVYEKYLHDTDSMLWVAVHKKTDAAVGYQLCTKPDLPIDLDPGDWELKRIYLFSRFQGSGLAARFVEQAAEEGRLRSKNRLLLGVNEDNVRAIGFYKKSGFEIVGERSFSVGSQHYRDVVMGLNL